MKEIVERENLNPEERSELARRELVFIRWQEKSSSLLTNSIGILFTLNSALIIFLLKEKSIANLDFAITENWPLGKLCCLLLAISALLGLFSIITRLFDFKLTARITRMKVIKYKKQKNLDGIKNYDFDLDKRIGCFRTTTRILGITTWLLFILEAIIFITTIILLITFL